MTLRALLCLLVVVSPAAAQETGAAVRFINGHWFDGERFVATPMSVVDGSFAAGDAAGAAEVDLEGGFVIPALADAHTHRFADGGDLEAQIGAALRAGILFAKNANSTRAGLVAGRQAVADSPLEVIYSGQGLTSPGGHPAQIYAQFGTTDATGPGFVAIDSEADLAAVWDDIVATRPDFLKVYLERSGDHQDRRGTEYYGKRGLDPQLLPGIVDRAHAADLPVAAHVNTAADVRTALAAGVDEINHLPLERLTARDAEACAAAGVTVVTTVLSHRQVDIPDEDAVHTHNLTLLRDAGVALALGTDNGGVDVVDEVQAIAKLGVFTPAELVNLVTTRSVQAIFSGRSVGELRAGQEATFLVLASDPLQDLSALRDIAHRYHRGQPLQPPAAPVEKPGVTGPMMHAFHTDGLDAAVARYHELKQSAPDDYDFGEQQLNGLGYGFLQRGRSADAVVLFELNAELFPGSANAFDSLAEGYLKVGEADKALTCYRRVLELLESGHVPESLKEQLKQTATAALGEGS